MNSPAEFSEEVSFPLDVFFCDSCSLVQLLDVVAPGILFDNYVYLTGTSDTMVAHFRSFAETVVDLLSLGSDDLVVEVASNDGSLLRCFQSAGMHCVGVEPATNVAEVARQCGVDTVNQFFNSNTARDIQASYGRARVVIANNVLAHVDDSPDFLLGCRELLRDDGMVIVEVPYLKDLLERLEYDTIYHEHLCYFSITSLLALFGSVDLSIDRIDHVPVHGGSLRVFARPAVGNSGHGDAVKELVETERAAGIDSFDRYQRFAADVEKSRATLRALLLSLKQADKTMAAYGAPAKGNTLLNYCGIDTDLLPFVVDKASLKVGRYTPGTHIPVLPTEELAIRQPDYTVILAWNLADEIMAQEHAYRRNNGKFIVPIPQPMIVN